MNDYKTICDYCYENTWYETEQPCKRSIRTGCTTCTSREYISDETSCTGTLRIIDTSMLDKRFLQYYESGQRIEVTYTYGERERFYVGKSTGWQPVWLAIKKSNSSGGSAISTKSIADIQGLNKYK